MVFVVCICRQVRRSLAFGCSDAFVLLIEQLLSPELNEGARSTVVSSLRDDGKSCGGRVTGTMVERSRKGCGRGEPAWKRNERSGVERKSVRRRRRRWSGRGRIAKKKKKTDRKS
ncbi:hypothetical protein PVAP13_7KG392000 [Panicum virgatum]|uniref:Uncharacterized protein n=1 Tax=Panicum virgatum TaxID=38727 RepID=A0A8T0QPM7_PANVG|nr:hypothetical protein PVAP13_7KG392000 [Panicum virgatum]